jgi:hypothetical protein
VTRKKFLAFYTATEAASAMKNVTPLEITGVEQLLRKPNSDHGEFQLTRAQEIQQPRPGHLAPERSGAQRFDFGGLDDFVARVRSFRYST